MALPGISTIGVKFGWARGTFDTKPSSFKQLTRINQIGGISLDVNEIDASALEDNIDKMIAGRASTGGNVSVTVNMTDDTLAEWQEVFTASAAAMAAGETIWFENWSPNRTTAFFFCAQTPPTFPMPEEGQNALETVEVQLTINEYKGPSAGIEPGVETPVSVTGVTLNKETTSIAEEATETLAATVAPANATNKSVTWSSSDDTVATVSTEGVVTGVAEGTATITVTTVDGSFTDTCAVTVTA